MTATTKKKVVFRRSSSPIRVRRCAISELLERLVEENVTGLFKQKSWKLSIQSTTILLNPIIYTILLYIILYNPIIYNICRY